MCAWNCWLLKEVTQPFYCRLFFQYESAIEKVDLTILKSDILLLLYSQILALREDNSAYESVRFIRSQQRTVANVVRIRGQSARRNHVQRGESTFLQVYNT